MLCIRNREIDMPVTPSAVEKQALSLSQKDRARLVMHLIDSMDERAGSAAADVEQVWLAEANSRYQAYLRGEEQALPSEQVFAQLRKDDI